MATFHELMVRVSAAMARKSGMPWDDFSQAERDMVVQRSYRIFGETWLKHFGGEVPTDDERLSKLGALLLREVEQVEREG